jgi:type II secretory pathway component GspD/PulD (secretin)
MKTISTLLTAAVLTAASVTSFAQEAESATNAPPANPGSAGVSPASSEPITQSSSAVATPALPEIHGQDAHATNDASGIRLNFSNAPLELVLKYLSDAAGFHIVLDTPARGNVTVISAHSMSKDEAVTLLNSVLNKNGLAAIRNGQFLTIVDRNEAKTRDIPVLTWDYDPESIPKSDEIVTLIIPIRYVEARQLVSDLSPFVSQQATIVANEAANSILITDTRANIRHFAEIIKAVDSSAEASTEIQVFRLRYANPTDVATLLGGIFPSSSSGTGTQSPIRFGGGNNRGGGFNRGGGGGFPGPGGFFAQMMANAGGGNTTQDRIRKQQQVVAVADLRTSSVVVTAQKDLIEQIGEMIKRLDVPSDRDQKVTVFRVEHGDPQAVAQVLQSTFGSTSTSRGGTTSSSQTSALQARENQNANSMGSSSSSGTSTMGTSRGGLGGSSGGGGTRF